MAKIGISFCTSKAGPTHAKKKKKNSTLNLCGTDMIVLAISLEETA